MSIMLQSSSASIPVVVVALVCALCIGGAPPLFLWVPVVSSFQPSFSSSSISSLRSDRNHMPHAPPHNKRQPPAAAAASVVLSMSGTGIAEKYSWKEEAFEIELSLYVPYETKAKDIRFQVTSTSIDLKIKNKHKEQGSAEEEYVTLLDGTKKMRGKIALDGTYWSLSDLANDDKRTEFEAIKSRQIIVSIEKNFGHYTLDDEAMIDHDWKGIYPGEEGIVEVQYDKPEALNVEEYCASLGVDINNIDMSKVDKTMYSSGLNETSGVDELIKAGYLSEKEVTQQADGKETTIVPNDNGNDYPEQQPFNPYGTHIGQDEIIEATTTTSSAPSPTTESNTNNNNDDNNKKKRSSSPATKTKIPFVDTSSQWHKQTKPLIVDTTNESVEEQEHMNNSIRKTILANNNSEESTTSRAAQQEEQRLQQEAADTKSAAKDPIDLLTVTKLKEVLQTCQLPVNGNKAALQTRLREHVENLVIETRSNPEQE